MNQRKQQREIDKAMERLMVYQPKKSRWQTYFREFMADMFAMVADLERLDIEDAENAVMDSDFGPMAFAYLFEEFATVNWVDTDRQGSMIDEYLKHRGWREGANGRRYLQILSQSELVFWEVTEVRPGAWVTVRRQGSTSKPMRVIERAGSQTINQWDGLVARVLKVNGERIFAGGMLSLSPQHKSLIDSLMANVADRMRQEFHDLVAANEIDTVPDDMDALIAEEVQDQTPMILFTAWVLMILRFSNSSDLDLRTLDDEVLAPSTVHWPVQGDRQHIASQLDALAELSKVDDDRWTWNSVSGSDSDDNDRILGFIYLGKTLELETLSSERAGRGQRLIEARLGSLLGKPLSRLRSLDTEPTAHTEPSQSLDPTQHPELEAVIQGHLSQHYRDTLDSPVPMLDNKTPRECAADPAHRPKVINWLKTLENTDARSPSTNYDMQWMWDELKLSRDAP